MNIYISVRSALAVGVAREPRPSVVSVMCEPGVNTPETREHHNVYTGSRRYLAYFCRTCVKYIVYTVKL